MRRLILGLVLMMGGCEYAAPSGITCGVSDSRVGFQCVDGYWVATGQADTSFPDVGDGGNNGSDLGTDLGSDLGTDTGLTDVTLPDMTDGGDEEMGCTPPTVAEFCQALGKNCGTVTGTDACGVERTEECGTCVAPNECQADNVCTCTAESDVAFCSRLGKDCGDVTLADNCGVVRTVNCGVCDGNETCGEQAPNVCGCPCLIGGTCFADGAPNPANACQACDPDASTTDWTTMTGTSCNDGDNCTINDTCDASAVCAGSTKNCSVANTECRVGVCDPSNGNCVGEPVADNTACSADAFSCTSDVCLAGLCEHPLNPGNCMIDNACVAAGATRPGNVCEKCDPMVSATSWTPNNGVSCNDGFLCTTNDVCTNRVCGGTLEGCFINDACVAEGAPRDATSCFVCDSSANPSTYTALPLGSDCPVEDSLTCTTQACGLNGTCERVIDLGFCVIDNACVGSGVENPNNNCQVCNPLVSQTAWSNRVNGTTCDVGGCVCTNGECRKTSNNQLCL